MSSYRDPTRPLDQRVEDLVSRMTLEEKAGLMFHPPIFMNEDGTLLDGTVDRIAGSHLNHFNIYFAPPPRQHAEWHNRLQDVARSTRLGIPVTISSDPRHGLAENFAAAWAAAGFSQWPEPIGFGALRDEEAVREFGDIARREYRAVGIHVALHPMADLATEPRWARNMHTFGEDAELAGRLVAAYVRGFQGDELGPASVACMTKHFPGGGPQRDGEAGCDQLGGEELPDVLVQLVRDGRISESRVDESARRLLRDKFRLGLFDDPYVDPDEAERICGSAEFRAAGERAQRRSAVIVTNRGVLPLSPGVRVYADGIVFDGSVARPEDADVAIVRRKAPFEPRTNGMIETFFHAGDLDFKPPELDALLDLARRVPTVLVLHLERPSVIPELVEACDAVVAVFGASDVAVLDILLGRVRAEGRLPFELPSSMAAVREQLPDVPGDSRDPLFRFGHGLG
jgi:beta-glucosidase-like glycosyl hydrolase